MGRKSKSTVVDDLINFIYLISLYFGFKVWNETNSLFLGGLAFGAGIAVIFIGLEVYKNSKDKKLFESGIDIIDNMKGDIFEKFLLLHFKNLGYVGNLTPSTADYGADLVLEKDGRKIVVQAKRWKQTVGIEAIQQVAGAIKHYHADKGMVITNSFFTENAYSLANSNGIELWDRKKVIELMRESKGRELAGKITNEDIEKETIDEIAITLESENCPKCGNKLVLRNGKRGKFLGCSGYPKCRFTKDFA